ncbi:gamma-type small acid-soluble spore protein [Sporosarcina limicola]|uniref:Small, acid-soluble spore protein gamma-type n=1 Tax=Sporosarcina limicola TaxID=34101 RepID=A0A927MJH6_9BACL|nr:gamma-type small acid-soluble spore protein [Sporosarcina limicola]MBE1555859.1 small acid-soluble spore protein E (minor gamma-type SASP) [Sporosarcina limicola]
MTNNKNQNQNQFKNPNQNPNQNQNPNTMREEFGSETDVNQVKEQNKQAEAKKNNASGPRANRFENGSK